MSDGHRKLILIPIDSTGMTTEQTEYVELDIVLSEDLLAELDEFRAGHGYPPRSAVVTEALRE